MTREEAITTLQEKYDYCKSFYDLAAHPEEDYPEMAKYLQSLQMALTALRPVSRELVEKVWRGCSWCTNEGKKPENWECSLLDDRGFSVVVGDEVVWTNAEFCPVCGKPLTDEAVEMVMERMEKLHEDNGCS